MGHDLQNRLIKKRNSYKGLHLYDVLITDDAVWSNYFNVSDVPDILTSGKNMFKLEGNTELLKKNSVIEVEILDRWGKPVFHTVNDYLDEHKRRMVTIWVKPSEVSAGPAFITIVGTAKRRPGGRPLKDNWLNRPNVRWRKKIFIDPTAKNNTPIIYPNGSGIYQTGNQGNPRIAINEIERGQVSNSYVTPSASNTLSIGQVSYWLQSNPGGRGNEAIIRFDFEGYPTNSYTSESYKLTSEMVGSNITIQPGNDALFTGSELPTSPPAYTTTITDVINSTTAVVSPRYQINTKFVPEPITSRDQPTLYPLPYWKVMDVPYFGPLHSQSNSVIPSYTMSYVQTPIAYETVSENKTSYANVVIGNLDPLCGDVSVVKTYTRLSGTSTWQLQGEDNIETKEMFFDSSNIFDRQPMGKFTTQSIVDNYWTAEWSSSHRVSYPDGLGYNQNTPVPTMSVDDLEQMDALYIEMPEGQNFISESFLRVSCKKEVPMYAETEYLLSFRISAKSMAYTKSGGRFQNTGSGNVYSGSGEYAAIPKMEVFMSGSAFAGDRPKAWPLEEKLGKHVQTFNAIYTVHQNLTQPQTTDSFGDAVSPVWASPGTYQHQRKFQFSVAQQIDEGKDVVHGQTVSNKPSAVDAAGVAVSPVGYTPPQVEMQPGDASLPTLPESPVVTPTYEVNDRVIGCIIKADYDGYGRPVFAIDNGEWYISDISITAVAETGFTPNHAMIESQLSLAQQDAKLDFKFEFLNEFGMKSDYVHYLYDVDFAGDNIYINGNDNHLEGTLIVGNGIIIQGRIAAN